MKSIAINAPEHDVDFGTAKRLADGIAKGLFDEQEVFCLSWLDRAAGRWSPAKADECHDECEVPGYIEYARSRGAELKVVVNHGEDYVFCYRSLATLVTS